MKPYMFERVFLPDFLRFVNIHAVTHALDSFYSSGSFRGLKDAYKTASNYCLSRFYEDGWQPEFDELEEEQAEFARSEWRRYLCYMMRRYFKMRNIKLATKDLEDLALIGEGGRE